MHPSTGPAGARPSAPDASRRLGAGEVCVFIASIAAVTVLAILQRPIPAVLTALVVAVCLLLLPWRASRLLAALASGNRE
ncbi:hypothetical protein ACI2LF_40455 [Kribbella sp. NPDC020789]|uniref:hypothetical protein n=1 Tax=Streptomyces TaxID=1883 RepID=UPI00193B8625|nr:hypothetical protein [Streptomyces sp. S-9]